VVLLKVNMHCEACAEQIKKRILKLSGIDFYLLMLRKLCFKWGLLSLKCLSILSFKIVEQGWKEWKRTWAHHK
jgi:Heavy-metal-associated domain